MQHRIVGDSHLEISVIALGTWAIGGFMWGGTDEKEAIEAIHASIDLGVTTIDTAPAYGFGLSEKIVGKAIKGKRDKLRILTKFGLAWSNPDGREFIESRTPEGETVRIYKDARKDYVIKECEESLRRLGTDHIDLYQQHWPDPDTPIDESMEALEKLIRDGKVVCGGVSNYSVPQMKAALETAPIISNQVPYSMLVRGIEDDLVPFSVENNLGILAYSPLERGLLTGKVTADREFSESDHRRNSKLFSRENRERINAFLDKIRPIAENHDATLSQLVIHWTYNRPGITSALVGARNARQAEENALAVGFRFTDEELNKINEELDNLKLIR